MRTMIILKMTTRMKKTIKMTKMMRKAAIVDPQLPALHRVDSPSDTKTRPFRFQAPRRALQLSNLSHIVCGERNVVTVHPLLLQARPRNEILTSLLLAMPPATHCYSKGPFEIQSLVLTLFIAKSSGIPPNILSLTEGSALVLFETGSGLVGMEL